MATGHQQTSTAPPTGDDRERERVAAEFARLYRHAAERTGNTVRWLGVPAFKLPLDLWTMQEIVFETRPQLVIEAGAAHGGTTLFLASLLDLIGEGEVMAVDVDLSAVDARVRAHPRVTLVEGSSVDPRNVARLRQAAAGKRVMVDLDSARDAGHVLAELEALSALVSPGCYLMVEDTIIDGSCVVEDFRSGPAEALREWLSTGPPFDVDASREHMAATFNPGGYLRRRGEPEVALDPPSEPVRRLGASAPAAPPAGDARLDPARTLERVATLVGADRRVLDLRCEAGELAHLLAGAGCTVVGLEPAAELAARAEEACERVIVGEAERIDLAAELGEQEFDVIVAVDALERLHDPAGALRRLARHLRPDGRLVATVRNVAHASVRLALLEGRLPTGAGAVLMDGQASWFTLDSVESALGDGGFALGEIERETLALDPADLPAQLSGLSEVTARLERDPDAATRRFLLVAFPLGRTELRLQQRRLGELARRAQAAEAQAAGLAPWVPRAEIAETEVARLGALIGEHQQEIESLRASVLASSQRVRELDTALVRGRRLLEAEAASAATTRSADEDRLRGELAEARRELKRRRKSLRRARKRVAALERSLPVRVWRRLSAVAGVLLWPLRRLRGRRG